MTPFEVEVARRLARTYDSAKSRDKEFNLDFAYMHNIMKQTRCAYSGEEFSNEGLDSMSLERWNNNKGYIKGNVIPVKIKYNSVRSNFTNEELRDKIDSISSKIVRSSDKGKQISLTDEQQNKLRTAQETIVNIKANITQRKALIETMRRSGSTHSRTALQIESLETRIKGGKAEIARLERLIAGITGKVNGQRSKAEFQVKAFSIIIKAVESLENMTWLETKKLAKGLPLNCSLLQLIKGKM